MKGAAFGACNLHPCSGCEGPSGLATRRCIAGAVFGVAAPSTTNKSETLSCTFWSYFPMYAYWPSFTETSAPCRRHSSLPRIPILPCYRRRYPRLRKVDAASLQRNESINKGPLYRLRSSKTYSSTLNQLLVAAPISCPKRQNHL